MFCSRTHRSHIRGDLPADPPAPSACSVSGDSLGDLCWAFGSGVAVAGLITSHTPGTGKGQFANQGSEDTEVLSL